jgi:probable phosphoglycerate mutase
MSSRGVLHHLELWVDDLETAEASLGWLFVALGYELSRTWPDGRSWQRGETYIVVESGPDVKREPHDRRRPGLNHLAFSVGTEREVDELVVAAEQRGWSLMFGDRHPYAGGPNHYAAYLENADGFEVELVAHTS